MPLSGDFHLIPLSEIKVLKEKRQRSEVNNIEELADSIKRLGLINPITITRDNVLVAGERRLEAHKSLAVSEPRFSIIAAHYVDELDNHELQALELEENIKRDALYWKDIVTAVASYHSARKASDGDWTVELTAGQLGMSAGQVGKILQVSDALVAGDSHVAQAASIYSAYQVVNRKTQRAIDTAMSDIMDAGFEEKQDEEPRPEPDPNQPPLPIPDPVIRQSIRPVEGDIFKGDFNSWARDYRGPKFNFLHCDFPYGISLQDSDQAGAATQESAYDDGEEVYWKLLGTLADHHKNFLHQSCHIVFWFSMKFYGDTLNFFSENMPEFRVEPFPLIWMKSDGKGILPDPNRGPRRIYETALILSRADRFIIRAVNNAYAAPTGKKLHLSEKPEPVLRHFFQMFVDGLSEVLDPTCGAGSALRAAESLGASRVVGMDLVEENVTTARNELRTARVLRAASKKS